MEAGRLGAILIQFPWSFKNDPDSWQYLWRLQARFGEYPLVVELRHGSWIADEILDTYAELGLCNIDQPLFHRSAKPAAFTTAHVGYVRLHGHNYQKWFSQSANVRDRYDYLYSPGEQEPWVARIKHIAEDAPVLAFEETSNEHSGVLGVSPQMVSRPDIQAHIPADHNEGHGPGTSRGGGNRRSTRARLGAMRRQRC